MKTGVELIAEERQRQVEEEGYDAAHDTDEDHAHGELAWAACYYAAPEPLVRGLSHDDIKVIITPEIFFPRYWPFAEAKRARKCRIRQLVTAGALIAAEIDRQLRCGAMLPESEWQSGKETSDGNPVG